MLMPKKQGSMKQPEKESKEKVSYYMIETEHYRRRHKRKDKIEKI